MANKPTAAANRKDDTDPASAGRIKQIRMVAGIIRKSNPRALPIVALAGLGVIAVFVIVGLLTGLAALLIPLGVAAGLMVAMIIFGRYAQSAQYKAVEGQPGAAAAIMQSMRRRLDGHPGGLGQPQHGRGAPGGRQAGGRAGR